jgi:predicted amino acid-binding ACT domain protein
MLLISLLGEDHPGVLPHSHGVLHGEDQHILLVTLTLFLDTSIFCLLDVLISLLGDDHPGVLPHSHGVLHGDDQHILHDIVAEGYTHTLFLNTSLCWLLDVLGEDHPGVPHSHGVLTVVVEHAVVTVSVLHDADCTEL